MIHPLESSAPRHWWLRVSLRGLMVLVLVVAGGLGWYVDRVKTQRDAVAAIRASWGGWVEYDWGYPPVHPYNPAAHTEPTGRLARWLGPDWFGSVVSVQLSQEADDRVMAQVLRLPGLREFDGHDLRRVTDAQASRLADLPLLQEIQLGDDFADSHLTGAVLARFARLDRLQVLHLIGVPVHDADLAALAGLSRLEILQLRATQLTDASLIHLRGLTRLRQLGLSGLPITTAGLESLRGLPNLEVVDLGSTQVRAIAPLVGLPRLINLNLAGTPLTDPGLAGLAAMSNLQALDLSQTAITDAGLDHLAGLTSLRRLRLVDTQVTPERLERLGHTLPGLKVITAIPAPPGGLRKAR